MKIRNAALSLVLSAAVVIGLGQMTTLAANKDISMDLTKAIQHMVKVKIISGNNSAILKHAGGGSFGIETDNFVISQTGDNLNVITGNNKGSSILGGIKNIINGSYSSILGGDSNENDGNFSSILGGKSNTISNGVNNSSIVGGSDNKLLGGNGSVIIGGNSNELEGNYSALLGNDASVSGNYSVALGSNSNVNANNSFLWTDGSNASSLGQNNVFVVMSENGMVVNSSKASSSAQLTIGGPLVINNSSKDVVSCSPDSKGVIKVVDGDNNHKCFCSCDGQGYWHSLYGQGRCEGKCNGDKEIKPECNGGVSVVNEGGYNVFLGTCKKGNPVSGEGAYSVDQQGMVHWMCQTDAGLIANCTGYVN